MKTVTMPDDVFQVISPYLVGHNVLTSEAMTVKKAAEVHEVSESTLRRWMRSKVLAYSQPTGRNGMIFITSADVATLKLMGSKPKQTRRYSRSAEKKRRIYV